MDDEDNALASGTMVELEEKRDPGAEELAEDEWADLPELPQKEDEVSEMDAVELTPSKEGAGFCFWQPAYFWFWFMITSLVLVSTSRCALYFLLIVHAVLSILLLYSLPDYDMSSLFGRLSCTVQSRRRRMTVNMALLCLVASPCNLNQMIIKGWFQVM